MAEGLYSPFLLLVILISLRAARPTALQTMTFRRFSESFALVGPALDLVEFTIFPDREDAMVQRYVVKVDRTYGTSWYAPSGKAETWSKEDARWMWGSLVRSGYKRKGD